jgi:aquaporin Z
MTNQEMRELAAEFVGTFTLVTAVCGAALFSAPSAGLVAVAFAVGLSVLAMAYAVGHISGGHFNPAVTLGLVAAGKFNSDKAPLYIVVQVAGGIAAALVFYGILCGVPAGAKVNDFLAISNMYGGPAGYSLISVGLIEIVITALFVMVIVGSTSPNSPGQFAPIAIGLALVLFHLVAIPVSNASLNPARSTATAILGGADAMKCLWLFWLAPILGGVIGGYVSAWLQTNLPARILPRKPVRRRR